MNFGKREIISIELTLKLENPNIYKINVFIWLCSFWTEIFRFTSLVPPGENGNDKKELNQQKPFCLYADSCQQTTT